MSIGARLGVGPHTVGKWLRRFLARHVEGLHDERKPVICRGFLPAIPPGSGTIRAHIVPVTRGFCRVAEGVAVIGLSRTASHSRGANTGLAESDAHALPFTAGSGCSEKASANRYRPRREAIGPSSSMRSQ
jgi:hypothetical protein